MILYFFFFFFSSRRRHTRYWRDWSSDVCSSDLSMGLPDVGQLVDSVRTRPSPESTRRIVEALTTNETSWFRDGDPFTALTSTVLPSLLAARGPAERLQIWSAACSSGQESYTIAMLLEDALPNAASRVSIKIGRAHV